MAMISANVPIFDGHELDDAPRESKRRTSRLLIGEAPGTDHSDICRSVSREAEYSVASPFRDLYFVSDVPNRINWP